MASLAEGMAQALMQVKMMKRQDAERAVRDEYLKAQKKILDAQVKALEAENAWWDSQPQNIQKLRHLPKEMQMLGFMGMGLQPPPTLPGAGAGPQLNLQENMTPVPGTPGAGGAPAPPQGGLPDVMSQLVMRGMFNKMLGIDPGAVKHLKGIAGPGGAPVTLPVNEATGMPMGPGMPEAVKPEGLEFTGPGGEKRQLFYDPYAPGAGMGGQGIMTAPSKADMPLPLNQVNTLRHAETGGKAPPGITLNQAIEGNYIPLAPSQEKAITSAKSALEAMNELGKLIDRLDFADSPAERLIRGPALYAGAYAQTNTDAAVFLKMTKAMIPKFARAQGEVGNLAEKEQQRAFESIPKLTDTKEVAKEKLAVLTEILVGTAERSSGVAVRGVEGMKKPPKLGGKGGYDYEYIPGQGLK